MDRVGHIRNGNRSRSQSSREVRNKTQSNTIEMAALILAAGDFDESNLSTIGSANKRGNSKALLSVGNKPQLFHSIGMLESAGFEKSQIFVAIEPDDLVQYEENERIVPVESRIPQANMLLVEEPKSSADTLAEGLFKLSQVCDGLPNYVLVVYVDILHCGVLRELAKFNRTTDSAFTSVYGPSTKTISSLAAFPGGEAIYKAKPPTKLTFLSGDNHHNNKIRKLHLAVDTESLESEELKLSKRVMAAGDHIEVVTDLDDQGVFLIRNDVAQFIIANCDDRDSIRQSLIPSLLKRQFPGTKLDQSGIEKPFECYALVDEESTWRLNSLHNYVEAHRAIVGRQLLAGQYKDFKNSAHLKEKFIDVCADTIVGENMERFNEAEDERRTADLERSGDESEVKKDLSKVIIRKSIIGDMFKVEYAANNPSEIKSALVSIQNCIVMSNVTINAGCRLNNCIISSDATIGPKCNLTNCIIGPGATVTGLTNSRDTTIGLEHDTDIVIE